jgi:tetratricopeptide (TPR) repeat protein
LVDGRLNVDADVDHRSLGVALFNEVWRLMETREDDERMLHAGHASAYHWKAAPECEPKNRARSEWQLSRVYAVLGRPEPALHHAQRCLEICEADPENMEDWDLPFAYEALARAHVVAGDATEARRFEERARKLGAELADTEDREHLDEALATLPG